MSEASKEPPPAPAPSEVAKAVRAEIEGGTVIVGAGQFSPWSGHDRVGVLRVDGAGEPALVYDAFHPRAEIEPIRDALSAFVQVWPGEFDMMYATLWKLAWTVAPAPFRLYEREGIACLVEGGVVRIGSRTEVPVAEIASVLGWADGDAVLRGVDLVRRSGERVCVAAEEELAASIDPTYDRLDLMFDASWVPALGRALAAAIGVTYEASERALM
jgi:hypothetical protein